MSIDRMYYFLYIDAFRTFSDYPRNREKRQTLHTFLTSKPRDAFTESSNHIILSLSWSLTLKKKKKEEKGI